MDGGGAKSRLRCISGGKRTRERHEPELSHRKGGLGSGAVSPVLDGHTVPLLIGALGWSEVLLSQ